MTTLVRRSFLGPSIALVFAACSSPLAYPVEAEVSTVSALSNEAAELAAVEACHGPHPSRGQCTACVAHLLDALVDQGVVTATQKGALVARFAQGVCRGACVPTRCELAGVACGLADDGCGATLDCGACAPPPCAPITCKQAGASCGPVDNGCGATLDCGACAPGSRCEHNQCACVPKTCDDLAAECGFADDGCGHPLDCGRCAPGMACGDTNRCACGEPDPAATCAAEKCGIATDACGRAFLCGPCR